MTFSINLPIVLSKIMGWKALGELYGFFLDLEITIDIETLKCCSQWLSLIQVLAILMSFLRHATSLTYLLKCLYDNLSGLGVDKLFYFAIALINSSSKNSPNFMICLLGIYSSKSRSTW